VTREGLPNLLIKDLPPSFDADLKVERPEIYYGEKTEEYILVKTKTKEFDYPKGDKNVYTTYQGTGGSQYKIFSPKTIICPWVFRSTDTIHNIFKPGEQNNVRPPD